MNHIDKKIQISKRDLGAILSLGSPAVPVSTKIATNLYRSLCLSKLCYGAEIAEIPKQCVDKVEQFHGQAAKKIQGIPPQSSNAACLAPLGWISLQGHIDLLMMTFLWRMILLPVSSIYKQVLIARLYHCIYEDGIHLGPVKQMVDAFVKYSLLDLLLSALTSAETISILQFKNTVRKRILSYETNCFKATMIMYKHLHIFKVCVKSIKEWVWWTFCNREHVRLQRKARTLACLLLGESCLLMDSNKMNKTGIICNLCDSGQPEDLAHLLFLCDHFKDLRHSLWRTVQTNAPEAMFNDINVMTPSQRTHFLMSGLGREFVPEWDDLYESVLDFIVSMYKCRLNQAQVIQA